MKFSGGHWVGVLLVAAVLVGAGATLWFLPTQAATNITIKGIATDLNVTDKTMKVDVATSTKTSLLDTNVEINIANARFFKWTNGVKKRVTMGNVGNMGDEYVIVMTPKANSAYSASTVTANDRSFNIVGLAREIDTATKRVRLEVTYSSYRNSYYKGREVWFTYDDDTRFVTTTNSNIDIADWRADNQRVKVIGTITGTTWEFTKLIDRYKKAK